MVDMVIGAAVAAVFAALAGLARRHHVRLRAWQWGMVGAGFIYSALVLRAASDLLKEGSGRAALVVGLAFGSVAAAWVALSFLVVWRRRQSDGHPAVLSGTSPSAVVPEGRS